MPLWLAWLAQDDAQRFAGHLPQRPLGLQALRGGVDWHEPSGVHQVGVLRSFQHLPLRRLELPAAREGGDLSTEHQLYLSVRVRPRHQQRPLKRLCQVALAKPDRPDITCLVAYHRLGRAEPSIPAEPHFRGFPQRYHHRLLVAWPELGHGAALAIVQVPAREEVKEVAHGRHAQPCKLISAGAGDGTHDCDGRPKANGSRGGNGGLCPGPHPRAPASDRRWHVAQQPLSLAGPRRATLKG